MSGLESIDLVNLGKALMLWLLVAIIIEEVCNVVFNWKVYTNSGLVGRGLKTPFIFVVSLVVSASFGIDIFKALMAPIGVTIESGPVSYLLTAALLNGGSGTVYRVFNRVREGKTKLAGGG